PAVGRAALLEDLVARGWLSPGLQELLEGGLGVPLVGEAGAGKPTEVRRKLPVQEAACRLEPAVQIDGRHQRLERIGKQRAFGPGAHLFGGLSQEEMRCNSQSPGLGSKRLGVYQGGLVP